MDDVHAVADALGPAQRDGAVDAVGSVRFAGVDRQPKAGFVDDTE